MSNAEGMEKHTLSSLPGAKGRLGGTPTAGLWGGCRGSGGMQGAWNMLLIIPSRRIGAARRHGPQRLHGGRRAPRGRVAHAQLPRGVAAPGKHLRPRRLHLRHAQTYLRVAMAYPYAPRKRCCNAQCCSTDWWNVCSNLTSEQSTKQHSYQLTKSSVHAAPQPLRMCTLLHV